VDCTESPGPAGGAIAFPRSRSRYQGEEREGRGRKALGIKIGKGREGKDVKG